VSGAPPRPLHVALLTGEYPPTRGGVGDYTACLARALARQTVRCSVVTTYLPGRSAGRERRPFDPVVCPAIRRWGWGSWRHLAALLRDLRPDVVHLQYQTGAFGMHPAVNLLPLALRAASRGAPFVATFHDLKDPYLFPKAGPLRPFANALLRRFADAVVVTNEEDHDRVRGPKVREIPIGSNIDPIRLGSAGRAEARVRLGLRPDEVAVGYFGFINEWKGVDTLIDAFRLLLAEGRDARLVFVGGARREGASGSWSFEAAIRRRLDEEPFRGNVVWTGFGDAGEISGFLHALDVCALPFVEGASYRHGTLVAAIAHGLPIVTTRPPRSEARRAGRLPPLADGESCRLVPPRDPSALAAAIAEIADRPPLRGRIAAGAAALAPRFGWDAIAGETRGLYDALLGRAQPSKARSHLAVAG
jgi:glycosyltransferase involved in cell wall biosynthesis